MSDQKNTGMQQLTDREFRTIAQYIETTVGIKMPETKRIMMQSRLMSRLRVLGLTTYKEYIDYVFNKDPKKEELVLMTDALTTNKTEFFRESDHFDYLSAKAIPSLLENGRRPIRLWSAPCSSGEEVYTLAIVMKEYMSKHPGDVSSFSIVGSDISTKVLDKAVAAVYDLESIEDLPLDLKRKYFLKSTDDGKSMVRVKPELRAAVSFKHQNFMDDDYGMRDPFQIIFCRNMLIYFDKPTQEKTIRKLLLSLETGGYLFLGHSETILAMDLPLKTVAPTVYKKI
jgi:chemotaxis protein methyltransferase CheR